MKEIGEIKLELGVKYLHSYGWEKWLDRNLVCHLNWDKDPPNNSTGQFSITKWIINQDEWDKILEEEIPPLTAELKRQSQISGDEFCVDISDSIFEVNKRGNSDGSKLLSVSYLIRKN